MAAELALGSPRVEHGFLLLREPSEKNRTPQKWHLGNTARSPYLQKYNTSKLKRGGACKVMKGHGFTGRDSQPPDHAPKWTDPETEPELPCDGIVRD